MSFSGYSTALEMRRLIETVAAGVVNKLRPRPRYGSVQSIDDENAKCTVLFVGDPEPVEVNMTVVRPDTIGQRVLVEGNSADKYVSEVFGPRLVGNRDAPPGSITMFAGSSAPEGYLLCQGQAVSRSTYSDLFAVIGTTYGSGDNSTTFNVPNLEGRVPVGLDTSQTEFNVLGETGGAKTHTLTSGEMPSHVHDQYVTASPGGYIDGRESWTGDKLVAPYPSGITTGSSGGGGAHNNLQPYIVLNYIIKA
jgi:microcystin-dependent protein